MRPWINKKYLEDGRKNKVRSFSIFSSCRKRAERALVHKNKIKSKTLSHMIPNIMRDESQIILIIENLYISSIKADKRQLKNDGI